MPTRSYFKPFQKLEEMLLLLITACTLIGSLSANIFTCDYCLCKKTCESFQLTYDTCLNRGPYIDTVEAIYSMECWCKNEDSKEVQVRFSTKLKSRMVNNKENPYVIHYTTKFAIVTCDEDKCNNVCGGADEDISQKYGKCRITKYKDHADDQPSFVKRCHCLILHKVLKPMEQGKQNSTVITNLLSFEQDKMKRALNNLLDDFNIDTCNPMTTEDTHIEHITTAKPTNKPIPAEDSIFTCNKQMCKDACLQANLPFSSCSKVDRFVSYMTKDFFIYTVTPSNPMIQCDIRNCQATCDNSNMGSKKPTSCGNSIFALISPPGTFHFSCICYY